MVNSRAEMMFRTDRELKALLKAKKETSMKE